MKKLKINKRGIIISLAIIALTGCIGFKILGNQEEEIPDKVFEKLFLIQGYVPEQEIVENKERFRNQWEKTNEVLTWVELDKEYKSIGLKNPNLKNFLNENVYVGTKEERKKNINAYNNTINCITYLEDELYKKENKELEDELFTLVEDYIYNSRMGNIEDILLSRSEEVDESLVDLQKFIKDNKIKIDDITFDRVYYGYTVGSLPLDFKISYAIEVKDGKHQLCGTMDQTVYLDLADETLYSDWKKTKKNKDYKFKVVGVENFNFDEFMPEE